jgi:cold-inducible RNA-binding protein
MGRRLFVGNLPYTVTDEDLKEYFSQFGAVEYAHVITSRDTGTSKGFGFVEMSTQAEADLVNATPHRIGPRDLTVNEARPKPEFEGGGGGGGKRDHQRHGDRQRSSGREPREPRW